MIFKFEFMWWIVYSIFWKVAPQIDLTYSYQSSIQKENCRYQIFLPILKLYYTQDLQLELLETVFMCHWAVSLFYFQPNFPQNNHYGNRENWHTSTIMSLCSIFLLQHCNIFYIVPYRKIKGLLLEQSTLYLPPKISSTKIQFMPHQMSWKRLDKGYLTQ